MAAADLLPPLSYTDLELESFLTGEGAYGTLAAPKR